MIIVKLMGGLGNQMFQYAAARSLALRHGVPLKLDMSFLEGSQIGNTRRHYALGHFAVTADKATSWEVSQMTGCGRTTLETIASRISGAFHRFVYYRERCFHYDKQVFHLPDNTYLEGYWQSEKYFDDIAEIIRQEFTVVTLPDRKNRELADYIRTVPAVSLHVRRGDYVNDPVTKAVHGVCNIEYYCKAVELLLQSVDNPYLFIFSDDPNWCATNLRLPFPACFVDYNSEYPHEDLRLMSLCRHHIIANSSFSWWGAWLSNNPTKIVIAPKTWFNDATINTDDITPVGWQRI